MSLDLSASPPVDDRICRCLQTAGLIRSLALAHPLFGAYLVAPSPGRTPEAEQVPVLAVARLVHRLLPERAGGEAAFTAGPHLDGGKLIIVSRDGMPAIESRPDQAMLERSGWIERLGDRRETAGGALALERA